MREDRQQRKDQYADISDNATNLCEEILGHVAELSSVFSVTYLYWAGAWLGVRASGCQLRCSTCEECASAGRVIIAGTGRPLCINRSYVLSNMALYRIK